jgi:hypothetical protein
MRRTFKAKLRCAPSPLLGERAGVRGVALDQTWNVKISILPASRTLTYPLTLTLSPERGEGKCAQFLYHL